LLLLYISLACIVTCSWAWLPSVENLAARGESGPKTIPNWVWQSVASVATNAAAFVFKTFHF
jgi:hypothetical protein